MAVAVSLRRVVDELEAQTEGSAAHLNRETGDLYTLREEEAGLVENDADLDDLPDWQRDDVDGVREVLESEDWLPLPTSFDIHEWPIMDESSRSIDDPDLRGELQNAIRGAGAFRCFKDSLHRRGIHGSWHSYKTAALEQIAVEWLDRHGISYNRDEGAAKAG